MFTIKKYLSVSNALIAISLLVALLSKLGAVDAILSPLWIADPASHGLDNIMHGEVWRLITPIFIHFGVMHLVFNMMAMWDLGKLIESRRSTAFYLLFIVVLGIGSNLVQFLLTQSPFFGGMSGVLYGLFGYIWMQGRTNPRFGIILTQQTIVMMLGWFVLCWVGVLGSIANWAHTGGLLIGVAWGYLDKR
ncbi:rhomboid family intramembrane serine protease [Undibacterium sp. Xuan67W]|uniref:rhomboid family intramembrane serine protease n=1 Tax=Undibacterium sp. Xuan67W TaxID=3413057 RepID=UPI003BEFB523